MEYVHFSKCRSAGPTQVGEPFLCVAIGHTRHLGNDLLFVDDRRPPIHLIATVIIS